MWNDIFDFLREHIRTSWLWLSVVVAVIVAVFALFNALRWRRHRPLEIKRRRAELRRRQDATLDGLSEDVLVVRKAGANIERPSLAPRVEPGLLVENVPREMRVSAPETVEVRVARSGVEKLAEGMTGKPRSH
jgi:hypothetical protein